MDWNEEEKLIRRILRTANLNTSVVWGRDSSRSRKHYSWHIFKSVLMTEQGSCVCRGGALPAAVSRGGGYQEGSSPRAPLMAQQKASTVNTGPTNQLQQLPRPREHHSTLIISMSTERVWTGKKQKKTDETEEEQQQNEMEMEFNRKGRAICFHSLEE
ncbi:unnamed protein product [Bubo scandiacus]